MRKRMHASGGWAKAQWRCEEERFSAVAAHPLLGQPLLALDQHEEVTCTRREHGQIFVQGCCATGRNWGSYIHWGGLKGGSPEYHEQPRAKAPPCPNALRRSQGGACGAGGVRVVVEVVMVDSLRCGYEARPKSLEPRGTAPRSGSSPSCNLMYVQAV